MIIATAESNRQVKALARHVRDKLKEAGATIIGVEGEETGEWVLVDAGDIVVHIMQPAVRALLQPRGALGAAQPSKRRAKAAPTAPRPDARDRAGARRDRACRAAMKLRVVALGHRMPAWVDAGWDDYARRMPREFALELVELKPEPRDRGKPVRAAARRRGAAHRRRLQGRARRRARRARRSRGRRACSPTTWRAGATTRATSRS